MQRLNFFQSLGNAGLLLLLSLCLTVTNIQAAEEPAAKSEAKPGPDGAGKPPAAPRGGAGARATPVKVATAQRMTLAPQSWVAGTVISRDEVRVATEVAGKLLRVAEVGDTVQAGDTLARIDATFVELKIEEYKAAVESEQANLGFLESELKRLNRLAQQNNAAQTRLEEVRANQEMARSKLLIAKTRLKQAEEEYRRHTLVAPFPGVVVERYMRPGEHAALGAEVLRLIDVGSIEVQAWIPLRARDFVRPGTLLTLTTDERTVQGRVRALVGAGDELSRLLELRVSISGEGWTIGQPVRIAIPTAAPQEVLAVPRDALVLRRDGAMVFRINGQNMAQPVPVQLGVASGPHMAVRGELQPGDKVVVRGGERLRPGAPVAILPDDPPPGSARNAKPGGPGNPDAAGDAAAAPAKQE